MRSLFAALILLPLLSWAAPEYGTVERDHIRAELIAEITAVEPGQSFWAGLRLEPDDNWHTYWLNPGDSGLPTQLHWDLPDGVKAGEIEWAWPEALQMGHLVNYGYKDGHLLPVRIDTPDSLVPGETLTLVVDAAWLVCEEICIPGDATLALDLDVIDHGQRRESPHAALFADTLERVPEKAGWTARFNTEGGNLSVQVVPEDIDLSGDLAFFVINDNLVEHAREPSVLAENGQILVSQPLSAYFSRAPEQLEFILVDHDAGQAWHLSAETGELLSAGALVDSSSPGWALALILALAGGVLLNLMPCVFPVLSIKAMSLVSGAGHDQRGHGLAYTAGVLVSFAVLAAVLLALRAGGEAIGWGFQLQSAWFVALLVYILFALGLSLSGLFDFGTRLMGIGQGLTEKGGSRGSFFTGVLACVVASPCTAPFMGAALGAAVFMPWPMAMSVFLALGFGLALPMLVLSFSPALARRLPRPGPWMETFKQAMAFPLYLAVVWLLWVLARQTDPTGLALVLSGMVVLAFALWLGGRESRGESLVVARHAAVGLSLIFVLSTLFSADRFGGAEAVSVDNAHWETYSAETLAELRDDPERAVLVNMTADWCITCLVNERVALNTSAVREAMEENDVVYLKGDWTRRDPDITEYLSSYDRNGVPLYVLYPRNGEDPRVLPQVLTPQLVIQALERS
ncbi:thioredoxin family protein [Wenzhouxiangella sp. AB-CW3]|nr:thioredoxin family protein [Wenzhouxiangella sp. AB-CW3]